MTSRLIFTKIDFKLFGENFVKNQRSDRETSCIKSRWEQVGASAGQEEKVKPPWRWNSSEVLSFWSLVGDGCKKVL